MAHTESPLRPTRIYPASGPAPGRTVGPVRARLADAADAVAAWAAHWARVSWYYVTLSAEGYVELATLWARAEGIEQEFITQSEIAREKTRATLTKRLSRARTEEDRQHLSKQMAALDSPFADWKRHSGATVRAAATRLLRGLVCIAVPIGLVVLPPYVAVAAASPVPLLVWPVAYLTMTWMGRIRLLREGRAVPVEVSQAPTTTPRGETTARIVGATRDETRILTRLGGAYWDKHARSRGLDGISPAAPELDDSGISVALALGGKWTPGRVRGATDRIRAMLAVPKDAGTQVTPGATGDEAVLRVRTRTPALDTRWHRDRDGIGIVPETGRIVDVDPYGFRLVAGTTGAGKSVAMRPWMAQVVLNPNAALVVVDPKGQEAHLWDHCAYTVKGVGAEGRDRMYSVICQVAEELEWRQDNATATTWTPTPQHPELVLVVDEGAAIVRMSKIKAYKDVLDLLEFISTQGRAGLVWLIWATQYPIKDEGIPKQVTEMMTTRLSLRVDSPTADRVIFGENATGAGWTPSELEVPGWAMLRTGPKDSPDHIRIWHMTDDQVTELPARQPWRHDDTHQDTTDVELPPVLAAALELSDGANGVRGEDIARHLDVALTDVQEDLLALGVNAGRFYEDGEQVRGYRRDHLEDAARNHHA